MTLDFHISDVLLQIPSSMWTAAFHPSSPKALRSAFFLTALSEKFFQRRAE
jgi:hypothetical protein